MDLKDLILRNYNAVMARGLITIETTDKEFWDKLNEEFDEVHLPYERSDGKELSKELTDVMVVCINWLHHKGFDIEKLLTENAEKNEKRAKQMF